MQNLHADTQYAFCITNMWFNFQAHHHREYAAMETQGGATQANHYETIDYREYCLCHYHDSKNGTIAQHY